MLMTRFLVLMAAFLVAVTVWASIPTAPATMPFLDAEYETIPVDLTPATINPVPLVHTTVAPQESENLASRYACIYLTDEDVDLLARIIWLEARGECFEGQQAVAEVVFNRMLSGDFPDTLYGVIYEEGQFSTANRVGQATPGETQYRAIYEALTGPNILPLEVVFFATTAENDNVWGSIGGHTFCYPYYWEGE